MAPTSVCLGTDQIHHQTSVGIGIDSYMSLLLADASMKTKKQPQSRPFYP